MKHIDKLLLIMFLSACPFILKASNTINQDTIIKTITTVTVTDPATGKTETTITETQKIVPTETEGSFVYDNGASYNLIFAWDHMREKPRKRKKLRPHWAGIGMGFINYDDKDIPNGELKMSRSHNFTLNIASFSKQIEKSNFLFVSGLGLDWSRYHFDNNAALTKENGVTFFKPAPDGVHYKSTKLLSYYVTIPLLLEYQTGEFHISGGLTGFFKYYSKSQVKFYDQDGKHKKNMGRDLNIRPVDVKLRFQAGIKSLSIYGYYSPYSMFKDNKGPDLKPYTIGLMLRL